MMFCSSFDSSSIAEHITEEHPPKWEEYKRLDERERTFSFGDKKLPSRSNIFKRAKQLQLGWLNANKPKGTAQERNQDRVYARMEKGKVKHRQVEKGVEHHKTKEEEGTEVGETEVNGSAASSR